MSRADILRSALLGIAADALDDAVREQGLTDREAGHLLSEPRWFIQRTRHHEFFSSADAAAIEAMAARLRRLSAHDRLRLAALRAKTEQKPGNTAPPAATPDA